MKVLTEIVRSIALRFALFMLYASMAWLSVVSPARGRQMVDDAEAGVRAQRMGLRL